MSTADKDMGFYSIFNQTCTGFRYGLCCDLVSHIVQSYVPHAPYDEMYYRKTSSISRNKSQNWNVSCILLQLSSLNPLKPGVKLRMKM